MKTRISAVAIAAPLFFVAASSLAQEQQIASQAGPIAVETVADGLVHPWGMDFLPDGRMLVTEREGRLRVVAQDGQVSEPLGGVPEVFSQGQGGLLDVKLSPDFDQDRLVYLSFAEPGQGGASTAVARGRLEDGALQGTEVIFRQEPKMEGEAHFGSRLAFSPDGRLFITTGERFQFEPAQDLSNHLGTVVRINSDGSVPEDNPFVGVPNAQPEIWSYGHRNIQGAAVHPQTGQLWIHEHGPKGGDEVNVPEPGGNYGWPLVSWGVHYSGEDIPDPPTRPDLAQSVYQWTPVIAASGMDFYTGDLFSDWQGDLLVGGLVSKGVHRLELDGQSVTNEESVAVGDRVRQVQEGPDGAIYVLTDKDNGEVLRLTPGTPQTAGGD